MKLEGLPELPYPYVININNLKGKIDEYLVDSYDNREFSPQHRELIDKWRRGVLSYKEFNASARELHEKNQLFITEGISSITIISGNTNSGISRTIRDLVDTVLELED